MRDPRLQARLSAFQQQHDLSDEAMSALEAWLGELLGASTLISELDPDHQSEPAPPPIDDRYVPLKSIGRGGTGEVWRVQDQVLGRTLALKVLHEGHGRGTDLLQEAQAAARLHHPAIVTVHDVGVRPDGRMFYTMEEVSGQTLLDAIHGRAQGPVDAALRRLIGAVATVGQALAYAHDRGVIHRDVKPQNIMLGDYGEVRLLDFGVGVLGTPAYLAPELLTGIGAGPASDQFALGATLHHVVTGAPPYQGSADHVLAAVQAGPPPPPEGPAPLVEIAARATARDPTERYASCSDLAQALLDYLNGVLAEQRARAHLEEAARLAPDVARLRERSATLRQRSRETLRALPSYAPVHDKRDAWALEEESASLERTADRQELALLQTLRFAEREAPDLAEVHEALADHWRARHQRMERVDAADAEAALRWLAFHDRGSHAAYLQGHGRVSLDTVPRGARVSLFRVQPEGRRLRTRFVRDLGVTPLHEVAVEHGDYVLLVRSDTTCVRVPIRVGRLEHVDVQGFGRPLRLPTERLGPGQRFVPAGWASFGSEDQTQRTGMTPRRAWIDSFVMQRAPVTNRQYLAFLDALVSEGAVDEARARASHRDGASPSMKQDAAGRFTLVPDADGQLLEPDWPVFEVSWDDANAYARWISRVTGQPWRLPGELEWEKAARGIDSRRYPWGDKFEPTFCNMRSSHAQMTPMSVLDHPQDVSPYGVRGLAGNISDWCMDQYDASGPSIDDTGRWHPTVDPDADTTTLRTVRGGCWAFNVVACATTYRLALRPSHRRSSTGFRLVRSVPS